MSTTVYILKGYASIQYTCTTVCLQRTQVTRRQCDFCRSWIIGDIYIFIWQSLWATDSYYYPINTRTIVDSVSVAGTRWERSSVRKHVRSAHQLINHGYWYFLLLLRYIYPVKMAMRPWSLLSCDFSDRGYFHFEAAIL